MILATFDLPAILPMTQILILKFALRLFIAAQQQNLTSLVVELMIDLPLLQFEHVFEIHVLFYILICMAINLELHTF